eukprot:10238583-Heterocapsa_arctica.AAC.1
MEDKKFQVKLEHGCAMKIGEWEKCSKLVALVDTIKILNDDDALDLFKNILPNTAKTKSIADVEDLITKIEEHIAASASLNTEIKNLEKKVAENQDALDKAMVIREKQLAELNMEEKNLLQFISALKLAVT